MAAKYPDLSPEQEAFEIALDQNPQDWSLRLDYATYLMRIGKVEEANCQRWLGLNKQCPFLSHGLHAWTMYAESNPGHLYPEEISKNTGGYELRHFFISRRETELALSRDMAWAGMVVWTPKIPPDEE